MDDPLPPAPGPGAAPEPAPDAAAGGVAGAQDTIPPPASAAPVRKSGFAFFVVVLALFAVPGTLAQAASATLGLLWSEGFALLLPAAMAAAGSNLRARPALLLARRPGARAVALGAVIGLVAFFGAGAVMAVTSALLPATWVETFDVAKLFDRPPLERIGLSLVAALAAPACEEIAFRGWVLTALRTRHRDAAAIALSALFFALMHLDPVRFPALLALGLLYGWLAWRAGSIWPAAAAHAANNALGVALAAAGAGQVAGMPRPPLLQLAGAAALTLALSASLLVAFSGVYRRACPAPPPVEAALQRRDPADARSGFDLGRVPRPMRVAVLLGLATLLALVLAAQPHAR